MYKYEKHICAISFYVNNVSFEIVKIRKSDCDSRNIETKRLSKISDVLNNQQYTIVKCDCSECQNQVFVSERYNILENNPNYKIFGYTELPASIQIITIPEK